VSSRIVGSVPNPLPHRRRTHPRQRHGRIALSRDAILDAATTVLDAEGLDAVTMRRVAEVLGTGPASLYAHVQHKDDLVDAVLDRVIGEVDTSDPPDPERWAEQLKQFLRDGRATFARHQDIARASMANIPHGDNALPVVEYMLALLAAGGVPDQVAAWSADVLSLYLTATAVEESMETWSDGAAGEVDPHHHVEMERFMRSLDPARFPHIVALAGPLTTGDRDARFEFGLDMLMRGIASTVEPVSPAAGRPRRASRRAPTPRS
jgi:AcrR family transcriptional regulator